MVIKRHNFGKSNEKECTHGKLEIRKETRFIYVTIFISTSVFKLGQAGDWAEFSPRAHVMQEKNSARN